MGDGPVEWSVDGAVGIGVDPLVIIRGIGEASLTCCWVNSIHLVVPNG